MNHLYEILASALEYPGEDWDARLDRCRQWLTVQEPEVAVQLVSFRRKMRKLGIAELQELYRRTFVNDPVCQLDIGYHLFGDNDNRVRLLAKLREAEAACEVDYAKHSPDQLPVLLRLLTKLDDKERRHALIIEFLIPALGKMLDALHQANNPYQDLIEVIIGALKNELPAGGGSGIGDVGDRTRGSSNSSKAAANEKQAGGST